MHFTLLTLFPEMFPGFLAHSIAGKALAKNLWSYETIQIRDFATDKHATVDAKTYGGGTGLVMRADVVGAAIDAAKAKHPAARLVYFTPRGVPLSQPLVQELVGGDFTLLCGRYEGVDERILEEYQPLEISLGDYVLSGGEVAALTFMDAAIRLISGVISKEEAVSTESFSGDSDFAGLLEYPHYTLPPFWRERAVPEVLTSGNHQAVARWRRQKSEEITKLRRPDLWERTQKDKK
jgi:tRNA (guanine37-N1)-methyltransferase